jgi:hypothetical protein
VTGPIRASDLERTPLLTLAARHLYLEIRDSVARHAVDDRDHQQLAVSEHLELLATGDAIRRQVSHGRQVTVHRARQSGATWQVIADTSGVSVANARGDFLRWIAGQVRLWDDTPAGRTPIGLGPHARPGAYRLAADDPPDPKEVPNPR